ncbi:hypothetical protein [Tumebacillus lipolyticus]|uniref:Uncharacterized protein n=1 Tax=Tumebacillus lipolyticus TaxID=1280370 RepID=A0ABW5A1C9_9BACL
MSWFNVFLYLLFVACASLFQIKRLKRKEMKKELAVYSLLISLAAVIGALLIGGSELPSPSQPLQEVFSPLGRLLFQK